MTCSTQINLPQSKCFLNQPDADGIASLALDADGIANLALAAECSIEH